MDVPDPRERGAQRRQLYRQLKAACVALVGLSCGLIALYAGAPTLQIPLAIGAGLVLGVVLVVIVFPGRDYIDTSDSRRGS